MQIPTPGQLWARYHDSKLLKDQKLVEQKNELVAVIAEQLATEGVIHRPVEVRIPLGVPDVVVGAVRTEIGCAGYSVVDCETSETHWRWNVQCKTW